MLIQDEKFAMKEISRTGYYLTKWCAILLMIIDHVAILLNQTDCLNSSDFKYFEMRTIGRLAFPLFAYLIVESFYHTKNQKKHLLKILKIAIISEIPYNYFCNGTLLYEEQNVCFTLGIAFFTLMITDKVYNTYDNIKAILINVPIYIISMFTAYYLKTDYMYIGVLLIILFDIAKRVKHTTIMQSIAITVFMLLKSITNSAYYILVFEIIFLMFIQSKFRKGNENEYLLKIFSKKPLQIIASIFYPLHIIIICIIKFCK